MNTAATDIGNVIGLIILLGATIWVFLDAKAIRDDGGRSPGLVDVKPGAWAAGVFLLLIVVLPIYLIARVRFKRLLVQRRMEAAHLLDGVTAGATVDTARVWPPPPNRPEV